MTHEIIMSSYDLFVDRNGCEKEDEMIKISKSLIEELKTRWKPSKPRMEEVLDRVMGWSDADLRINLLGWLATRTDALIQEEAAEMVGALETMAYCSDIW